MHQRTFPHRSRQLKREKLAISSAEELDLADAEKGKARRESGNGLSTSGHLISSENCRGESPDVFIKQHHSPRAYPVRTRPEESNGFNNRSIYNTYSSSRDTYQRRSKSREERSGGRLFRFGKTDNKLGQYGVTLKKKPDVSTSTKYQVSGGGGYFIRSDSVEQGQSYLEDPQLSKLVNRVMREDERDRRLSACRLLKDYIVNEANAHHIQKMGFSLAQELSRILFDRTAIEVKREVANCTALLASALEKDLQSYLRWLFRKYNSTTNEEAQVFLLHSLLQLMRFGEEKEALTSAIPMTMEEIQSALEVTDSQQLLVAIVDIVLVIADRYTDVFETHFHDTVDILVGWHIDPQQAEPIIAYTSEALIRFHQYWVADISFSVTLLGQFLEDIEAYAEELSSLEDNQKIDDEELPEKISSLLRVYTTVIKSLKENFNPDFSPRITAAFIVENFSRLLISLLKTINAYVSDIIVVAANECIALLLSHIKEGALPFLEHISTLIDVQTGETAHCLPDRQTFSLLKLAIHVVVHINNRLPPEFIGKILGPESIFPKMRLWPSNKVKEQLLELYRSVFRLKTVPLLEEAYRYIFTDLQLTFSCLLGWSGHFSLQCNETGYDEDQALNCSIFNLCAIAEIGNNKHSLIAMLAFHPSIFDLLTVHLRPADSSLALNYPALQYAILFTLYSHCANHGYFLSNSSCLNALEVSSTDRPTTSSHFIAILDLLSQLLTGTSNSWDTRFFVVKWCHNLVASAINYLERICMCPAFIRLLHSLITSGFLTFDNELARYTADVLSLIVDNCWWKLPNDVLGRCFELCLVKMADFNDGTRAVFGKLFGHLPLGTIFKNPNVISMDSRNLFINDGVKVNGIQSVFDVRRRMQNRHSLGTFTSQDLRAVLDFILLGHRPKNRWSWLTNMFVANQRAGKLTKSEDHSLVLLAKSNQGVVWFWAAFEAAQFCVISKLRTPLGKPQDTLATIEVAVKNFTAEVLGQTVTSSEVTRLGNDGDPLFAHLRIKVLLDFMEQLEKMMYNAYEGCAVSLPVVPKAVKVFFRTNKTTCQEWLSRVRRVAITLALQLGYPAFAVRNGFYLVRSMYDAGNTQENDFHQAIFLLVQALIALHSSDAILGLYLWLKQKVGVKLAWIKPAVDLASGRYEDAAREFSCVIKSDALNAGHQTSAAINNFMKNQILESLRCIGSWDEICHWIKSETPKWGSADFPSELNVDYIQKMADFDVINEEIARTNFEDLRENYPTPTSWSLQCRIVRQNAEISAINFILNSENRDAKLSTEADHLSNMMKLGIMEAPLNLPLELTVLNHMIKRLDKKSQILTGPQFNNCNIDGKDMAALVQAVQWLPHVAEESHHDSVMRDVYLTAAKTARKNQNVQASQRWIMKGLDVVSPLTTSSLVIRLKSLAKELQISLIDAQYLREGSKLLHRLDHTVEAVQILSTAAASILARSEKPEMRTVEMHELSKINAKYILTLVKWVQSDSALLPAVSHLGRNGPSVNGYRNSQMMHGKEEIIGGDENEMEITVNRLLCTGTKQCPWLAKAWFELASWCYKSGKKAVDRAGESGIELTMDEVNQISTLLAKDSKENDIEVVRQMLSLIRIVESDEQQENHLDANYRQRILSTCSYLSDNSVDSLLVIWKSITERVYSHYRTACESYFTFLELNGSKCDSVAQSSDDPLNEDYNATATLRLLRLMVKHASDLRNVFEVGLNKTPVGPWKGIILQLFARLNHPEPYVRRSISDLLCRITVAFPHLIIFPAVVGSSAMPNQIKNRSQILGEYLSQVSDDIEAVGEDSASQEGGVPVDLTDMSDQQEQATVMQNCFAVMVDTLAKQDPKTVTEVQRLVHELRRITLLWDELWLGTLSQYHLDFTRRITQLEKEISKVKNNPSLSAEEKTNLIIKKHRAFLKPTLFILEQLQMVTSQTAETPHEIWFQETFGLMVQDAIWKLKNPTSPDQPQISGQVYKQLLYNLQQRVQKRSSLVLNMHQISPVLAGIKSTGIAMPIAHTQNQLSLANLVTIEAIDNVVSILPTKTKPKKLVFYGSDGRRYPFLFKGLEDLHLDERIMQLLTIVNNMFNCNKRNGKISNFRARYYSVTPLGPRSGLIQWVEGATPLFGLYKRWQQREATAPTHKSNPNNNQGTPIRPSEIYYNKLTPLLKENGIVNLGNRKEWSLSVLKQVLKELMSETPNDLLAKELWCSSTSAFEWWTMTETYARSVAVMSVIGYIIGLGDRHLDNVLVDLGSGEVIHIDYNVCFEKGKNLRVPEKVPFRMTPNIETALGLTGVEGTFRVSCEHVLKTLRRGRETLLTLLEAFVYDPLIDWTPGSEGGYTGAVYGGWQGGATSNLKQSKQEMECSLLNDLFQIRMAEMKVEWLNNQEEILGSLPKLENLLHKWIEAQQHLQSLEEELQELHQQMAVLKEAEANPLHSLHTLPQRCGEYLLTKERTKAVRIALEEAIGDCDRWHRMHKSALDTMRGPELNRWRVTVSKSQVLGALTLQPVVDFLNAAGKGQLLQQCEQAEKDVTGLLNQQQTLLKSTLEALTTYSAIVGQLPDSYIDENRNFRWRHWLQGLHDSFTFLKCQQLIEQIQSSQFLTNENADVSTVQAAMEVSCQLQNVAAEENSKLLKLVERLQLENSDPLCRTDSVDESRLAVASYVEDQGRYGAYSVACMAISLLAGHSRRLGVMESAALAAGDRLADYTSRDGDWFLDELYMLSANVDELISVLHMSHDVLSPVALASYKAVNSCHQVISSLQELHLNFQTIILPEALKCIQRRDSSVAYVFDQLDVLVTSVRTPLAMLIQQLEIQVRNVVMEMEPPASRANQLVEELKRKCQPLLEGGSETDSLSPGQMLMMGFNGLFTKLEHDFWHFRECSLPIMAAMPVSWRKVDIIREARSLMAPSLLDEAFNLLSNIFFVKRLQTILEVFKLSRQHSSILNGDIAITTASLYSEEAMARPVKCFIAEFIGKMMLGLQAQGVGLALCHSLECCNLDVRAEIDMRDIGAESKVSVDDLCRKTMELGLRRDLYEPAHFTMATSLLTDLERSWKKHTLINRLSQNILILKSVLQRSQLQLAQHQWLHESILIQGTNQTVSTIPTHSQFISAIRKNMQSLLSVESSVAVARERYLSLGNSVEQRLRWAAGANPSISSTLEDYERSLTSVNQLIVGMSKTISDVTSVCGSILHLETMRGQTQEALTTDNSYLQLINRCQESCMMEENCHAMVTLLEDKLLNVKPLDKHSSSTEWIKSVANCIAARVVDVQSHLNQQKADKLSASEAVKSQMICMYNHIGTHHRLMNEVRSILKSMSKFEEQSSKGIRQYFVSYRAFSEQVSQLVKEALAEEFTLELVSSFLTSVDQLKVATNQIYDKLVAMSGHLEMKDVDKGDNETEMAISSEMAVPKVIDECRLLAIRSGVGLLSGASQSSQPTVKVPTSSIAAGTNKKGVVIRNPRTGKAVQERNSYAVSVWKRVKMKLDGRDPDMNRRSTIPEQVDFIIREATNLDNLATLYEGWTPWV